MSELARGDVVAQRFEIERALGSGGMAHVYRAEDRETGRRVALKLLKENIADNQEAVERLRREGELLTRFHHPAIVGVEHIGRMPDGRLYLAMEYLKGRTLGALMRSQGTMSPEMLTPIVTGAAAGLRVAHDNGVIHRDLKPDNIFLVTSEQDPEQVQVKLLDFGISKVIDHERLTRTGQLLGTPRYMAPEQLAAARDIDGRIDTYALGVILYEALAGHPPFVGSNPQELVHAILHGEVTPLRSYLGDLDPRIEAVVARSMARVKDARFDTATSLAEAWVEAADSTGHGRRASTGMLTSALGAMSGLPMDPAARNDSVEPASFSDLQPGARNVSAPPAVGAAALDSSASGGTPAQRAAADVAAVPPVESGAGSHPTERGSRTWVWVGALTLALVVGALMAVLAIFVYSRVKGGDHVAPAIQPNFPVDGQPATQAPPDVRPPVQFDPQAAGIPGTPAVPGVPAVPPAAPGPTPTATHPTALAPAPQSPVTDGAPTTNPFGPPTSPAPEPTAPAAPDPGPPPAAPQGPTPSPPPPPTNEASFSQRARAAQRAGRYAECTRWAQRAIDAGSRSSYRTLGRCYEGLGDTRHAVKAYERYCRALGPNHRSLVSLRPRVVALGGRCE